MLTAIISIFIFLVLILIHELGHFLVAKSVGIKVNEFSIGMGPEIFHKQKGETKYTFRAIPAGGYVMMEGEDEDSEDPAGFGQAPVLARIAVVVAGAIMNFILAIIIFMIVSYGMGTPTNVVEEVSKGYPADISGMIPGDEIVRIEENSVDSWDDIIDGVGAANIGEDINIGVQRDGKNIEIKMRTTDEDGRVVIGVLPAREKSIGGAIKGGFTTTGNFIGSMFEFFGMLFTGKVSMDNLSGPVGVVNEIGTAASNGIYSVLALMGFISVNLGFFNLLPIPALDGGRLAFLILELVRGKPVDPNKEGMFHLIGFALLISLMLFVSYKDVLKLIIGE